MDHVYFLFTIFKLIQIKIRNESIKRSTTETLWQMICPTISEFLPKKIKIPRIHQKRLHLKEFVLKEFLFAPAERVSAPLPTIC
jgi:hypothetical protein